MNTIAITGASSGLGWQLALGLADKGKKLLLFGRDEGRLSQLKALVEAKGASCEICDADLLHPQGVQRAISAIQVFRPSLLVHSAGMGRYGHFCDLEYQASSDIIRLNVLSVMEITHAWANLVKQEKMERPKVIFIASVAAFLPIPSSNAYGASKACLVSFAEALRVEEEGKIDVLTVCPGYFATNFQRRASLAPLGDPSTEGARVVAEKIIKAIHKKGVYTPFPWSWIVPLRKLFPKSFLMRLLEKLLLRRMQQVMKKSD
jgi:short-subunit dehydrogenase